MNKLKYIVLTSMILLAGLVFSQNKVEKKRAAQTSSSNVEPTIKKVEMTNQKKTTVNKQTYRTSEKKLTPSKITPTITAVKKPNSKSSEKQTHKEFTSKARKEKSLLKPSLKKP